MKWVEARVMTERCNPANVRGATLVTGAATVPAVLTPATGSHPHSLHGRPEPGRAAPRIRRPRACRRADRWRVSSWAGPACPSYDPWPPWPSSSCWPHRRRPSRRRAPSPIRTCSCAMRSKSSTSGIGSCRRSDPAGYDSPEAYLEAVRYRPLDTTFSYITSRAASDAFYSESQYLGFGLSTSVIGHRDARPPGLRRQPGQRGRPGPWRPRHRHRRRAGRDAD